MRVGFIIVGFPTRLHQQILVSLLCYLLYGARLGKVWSAISLQAGGRFGGITMLGGLKTSKGLKGS